MGFDWSEWGNGRVHIGFALLAYSAALNRLLYKLGKTWPSELDSNELASLEIT